MRSPRDLELNCTFIPGDTQEHFLDYTVNRFFWLSLSILGGQDLVCSKDVFRFHFSGFPRHGNLNILAKVSHEQWSPTQLLGPQALILRRQQTLPRCPRLSRQQ